MYMYIVTILRLFQLCLLWDELGYTIIAKAFSHGLPKKVYCIQLYFIFGVIVNWDCSPFECIWPSFLARSFCRPRLRSTLKGGRPCISFGNTFHHPKATKGFCRSLASCPGPPRKIANQMKLLNEILIFAYRFRRFKLLDHLLGFRNGGSDKIGCPNFFNKVGHFPEKGTLTGWGYWRILQSFISDFLKIFASFSCLLDPFFVHKSLISQALQEKLPRALIWLRLTSKVLDACWFINLENSNRKIICWVLKWFGDARK